MKCGNRTQKVKENLYQLRINQNKAKKYNGGNIMLMYICNDCGFKTVNLDVHLIYRKEGKIIETPYVDNALLFMEHSESDLKGYSHFYYCEECNKFIKIYTGNEYNEGGDDFDEEGNNNEIKEYMKHKRPRYTIQTFMNEIDNNNLKCPKCSKQLSEVKKCLKCGSTNIFEREILD